MSNENSKELQEKILMSPKKKIHFVSKEELERADEFCEPYKDQEQSERLFLRLLPWLRKTALLSTTPM